MLLSGAMYYNLLLKKTTTRLQFFVGLTSLPVPASSILGEIAQLFNILYWKARLFYLLSKCIIFESPYVAFQPESTQQIQISFHLYY